MGLETTLTADEMKFFETGEMQPGMAPAPAPEPPPAPPAPAPAPTPAPAPNDPPAPAPGPAPAPAINAEAAEILRQALAEAQGRVGELEANIRALQQAQTPAPPPAPDRTADPLGSMFHQLDAVAKVVSDLQKQIGEQRDMQTQQSQFAAFQTQVNALRDEFAKTNPDFGAAYQHLRTARTDDMRALGMTDADIRTALVREEIALAQRSIQQGKNPAEAVYQMAQRHGYTKSAAPAPAPADPNAKIDAIQKAQQAAKNLQSQPVLEDITVAGLNEASDDDLNKIVNDPKLWGKITGADQYPL